MQSDPLPASGQLDPTPDAVESRLPSPSVIGDEWQVSEQRAWSVRLVPIVGGAGVDLQRQ